MALTPADRRKADITVALPPLQGFSLSGGTLHTVAAGATIDREATLTGSTLHIVEEVATTGGELAPADIAAEKASYSSLSSNPLRLRAPEDAPRSWDATLDRAKLKPIEDAYARLIEANKDESGYLFGRASFYMGLRDYKRAIADYDKAIALEASADNYAVRADARESLGDFAGAVADNQKAAELDPFGRARRRPGAVDGACWQVRRGADAGYASAYEQRKPTNEPRSSRHRRNCWHGCRGGRTDARPSPN